MKSYKNRVATRVLSVHISVIMLALVIPFLRGCFKPKPKDLITFIEFGTPAPAVEITEVPELKNPTLAPEEFITPPDRIPKPPKDTPPPKRPEKKPPKKKPPPKKPPKKHSNWKSTSVDDIRKEIKKSNRVKATKNTKSLSDSDIRNALKNITSRSPTQRVGNSTSFAAYDATITRIFTQAWRQPPSPGNRPAKVKISIRDSGKIIRRTLVQRSGDAGYDQTVMRAAQSISTLPHPPKGYPDRSFIIKFEFQ
jgi:TonB family protein